MKHLVNTHTAAASISYRGTKATVLATLILAIISINQANADRTYKVYKSNRYGIADNLSELTAVIEIDESTGRGTVYEANSFGFADIFKGPKYVIEPDMLQPLQPLVIDPRPCDDDHHRRGLRKGSRFTDDYDDEEDEHDHY